MQLTARFRSIFTAALVVAFLVAMISALTTSTAQAADPGDGKGVTVLTPLVDGEIAPSDSVGPMAVCPTCVCKLTTNQPHNSGHVAGNINVTASVTCTSAQPRVRVTVDLLEESLFGWDQVGTRGDKTVYNKNYVSTNSAITCSPGTYKGHGSGYYDDANGGKHGGSSDSAERTLSC